jgi:hypothetical protein
MSPLEGIIYRQIQIIVDGYIQDKDYDGMRRCMIDAIYNPNNQIHNAILFPILRSILEKLPIPDYVEMFDKLLLLK